MEWANENKFNSFNSYKGLTYYEGYKQIMEWMEGKSNYLPPPVECNLDPFAECNLRCYFCFDKNEKVTMPTLAHKKISKIKVGDYVLGYRNKKAIPSKVLNMFDNGRMDWLYKVTFADGDSIICTKDHKIWKANRSKWAKAKNLRVGNTVKKLLCFGNQKLANLTRNSNYKKGYIAGLAMGDGCMQGRHSRKRGGGEYKPLHYQFRLAMQDKEAMERFGSYCSGLGIGWSWGNHTYTYKYKGKEEHRIDRALYINKTKDCKCVNKLMEDVTSRGKVFKIGWIAGMFDAEGNINSGIRIHQNAGTATYEKLKDIASSLGYIFKEEAKGIRIYANTYNIMNFMLKHRPAISRKVNGYLINRDIYSNIKITKVERIRGQRRIFDLETETGNYFVKGVLVHNCITQRYLRTNRAEVGEMRQLPTEYMLRLVDFLAQWGVRGLCISGGGEPTIHKDLDKVILHAKDKMDVAVVTNATLITDKLDEALMACRWIALSIDSADWKTYKTVKGVNLFDYAIVNISRLAQLRAKTNSQVDLCYKFLILPENQHQIFRACKLAKELGVQDFHARPVDFERKDIIGNKQLVIDKDTVEKQFAKCHELENKDFRVYTVTHKFDPEFHIKHDFTQCLATPLLLPILQDGNAYLCVDKKVEAKFKLGSCYPDPEQVLTWWGSKEHRQLIKEVNIEGCSRCTLSQYNRQIEEAVIKDGMCLSFP